jgi:predicted O-methyltransferase YrrM
MKFSEINRLVGHVPFISTINARFLYDLIIKEKLFNILELGIAHGTATCYMAAALQELGGGKITAVDLVEAASEFDPAAEQQLSSTGLGELVKVVRMRTGYNWFLHDKILANTSAGNCRTEYDLCVIDGSKNWTIDGAAFFFVDKLLNRNGWIIFDDYSWTYAEADKWRVVTDGITHRTLSDDERTTPQIRDVFELLVVQHPSYSNFIRFVGTEWAIAQKATMGSKKQYAVIQNHRETYRDILAMMYHKVRDRLR